MAGKRNGEGGGRRGLRLATGTARRVAEEQERAKRTERMRLEEERMPPPPPRGRGTQRAPRGWREAQRMATPPWREHERRVTVSYCCVDGAARSAMEKGNDAELRSAARTKKLKWIAQQAGTTMYRGQGPGDRARATGGRAGGRHREAAGTQRMRRGTGQPNKHRRGRQRLNQRWGVGMGGEARAAASDTSAAPRRGGHGSSTSLMGCAREGEDQTRSRAEGREYNELPSKTQHDNKRRPRQQRQRIGN